MEVTLLMLQSLCRFELVKLVDVLEVPQQDSPLCVPAHSLVSTAEIPPF